ncbi:low choriolytic enzyme-like [Scylla paramamosain]|uniref:low choriolytic enzyme-like n=1 Tax=Scylla paramamosain TaxID=85552 RepID=UPI003082E85E
MIVTSTIAAAGMLRALRWPNATVPVEVSEGVLNSSHVHDIHAAMHYLNSLTCLKFVNATQQQYRVVVESSTGCGSLVGHVGVGEYQKLLLGASCFLQKGIVLHELLHVAGLFHEHTRPDRDQYVRVVWTNIRKDKHKNFVVPSWMRKSPDLVNLGLPYDFGSLLHYGLKVFTIDQERPSMVLRRPHEYTGLVGQRDAPSRADVARVNRLYECWNHYLGDDLPGAKAYLVWQAATLTHELSHFHTSDIEI